MTRAAIFLSAFAVVVAGLFAAPPAHAQRVFVSGSGSDSNPCSYAQPCRTFQQAFNTAAANGEIDVLDPAGYGAVTITHGISIQAHGFGGITEATNGASAITVSAGPSDVITLNGLLLDGAGTGDNGIYITSAGSVQILGSVIRHFSTGIFFYPASNQIHLSVSDTTMSDNGSWGFQLIPQGDVTNVLATLSNVTVNNNGIGPGNGGVSTNYSTVTIVDSDLSNNNTNGLAPAFSTVWIGRSVISGNGYGIWVDVGATVNSYGDNDVNGNGTDVTGGSLTEVSTD